MPSVILHISNEDPVLGEIDDVARDYRYHRTC